jgi:hypothetical protein
LSANRELFRNRKKNALGPQNTSLTNVENPVIPVHRGQRPPEPVPLLVSVVREGGVGVLQERDEDQEAVHHQQGGTVHLEYGGEVEALSVEVV